MTDRRSRDEKISKRVPDEPVADGFISSASAVASKGDICCNWKSIFKFKCATSFYKYSSNYTFLHISFVSWCNNSQDLEEMKSKMSN